MIIGINIDTENKFTKQTRYIFEHLFSVLGYPYEIVSFDDKLDFESYRIFINYGGNRSLEKFNNYLKKGGCVIHIDSDKKTYADQLPDINYFIFDKNTEIPFFYQCKSFDPKQGEILYKYKTEDRIAVNIIKKYKGHIIQIGFDIVLSTFFLLNRIEESIVTKRDKYQRFSSENSMAFQNNFLQLPVVDYYIKLLDKLIRVLIKKKNICITKKCYWPQNKKYSICLTHDVDFIKKWDTSWFKENIISFFNNLLKFKIKDAINKLSECLIPLSGETDPYWSFDNLISLEKELGYKSSFYFFTDNKRYKISDKKTKKMIKNICENGWDVGLHSSFESYNNLKKIEIEKKSIDNILGKPANGVRQHFLMFNPSNNWINYEKAGFNYDTTLGFADHYGFRASTSFPYHPYNFLEDKKASILEIPIIVMDGSFFHYLDYSSEEAYNSTISTVNTIKETNGICVMLWHSNSFSDDRPGWGETYYKIIKNIDRSKAWVTSASEISDWWTARNKLKLINVENKKNKIIWTFQTEKKLKHVFLKLFSINPKKIMLKGINNYKINAADETIIELKEIEEKNPFQIILKK